MPIFNVPAAVLPAFSFALETITEGVPSRFEKIATYLKEFTSRNPATLQSTCITIGHSGQTVECNLFDKADLRRIHAFIHQSPSKESLLSVLDFNDGFSDNSGIHPLVLIPTDTCCDQCGTSLVTETRPTFVSLYTVKGLCKASSFHKRCQTCKIRYHLSFKVGKDGRTVFKRDSIIQDHLLTSSKTGFETLFLRTTADLIETAALTFTAAAESYETTHTVHLERQRLEDAYFLLRLIELSAEQEESLSVTHGSDSNRIDIETACYDALEALKATSNKYVSHSCNIRGCKEGFVMADGIEKIHRRSCAAPTSAIKLTKSMPRILTSCPESPSFSKKSKYCEEHQYLEQQQSAEKRSRIVVTIDTIDMRVSTKVLPLLADLPDNNDTTVHVGCKQASKVDRFYQRTAGIMAIVRPCGIIIDHAEMLTCESPSQLFVQLLRLKCDSGAYLKYFGYDRACEFHPFLNNLLKKGNEGAKLLLEDISFLVDKFHINGHTTAKCNIADPLCMYHPNLARFKEIENANTECAEQAFSWLGKYKHMAKYMTQYKYKFFLSIIIQARNSRIERKQK